MSVLCSPVLVLSCSCHVFGVLPKGCQVAEGGGGGGGLYCVSNKETHFLASDNNHLNYKTLNLSTCESL